MMERALIADGRSHRVQFEPHEIREDLRAHIDEVQRLLREFSAQFAMRAREHDKSVMENFRQYVADINKAHAEGASMEKPWQTKEHAKAEDHHWDLHRPKRPTLVSLIEYLIERTVESWQFESLPPEPAPIDQDILIEAFRNTEEDIRNMQEG